MFNIISHLRKRSLLALALCVLAAQTIIADNIEDAGTPLDTLRAGNVIVKYTSAYNIDTIIIPPDTSSDRKLFWSGAVDHVRLGTLSQERRLKSGDDLGNEGGILSVTYAPGWSRLLLCNDNGDKQKLNVCLWGGEIKKDSAPDIQKTSNLVMTEDVNWYAIELPQSAHVSFFAPASVAMIISTNGKIRDYQEHWDNLSLDVPLPVGKHIIGIKSLTTRPITGTPLTIGINPIPSLKEDDPLDLSLVTGEKKIVKFYVRKKGDIGIGLFASGGAAEAVLLDKSGKTLANGRQIFIELDKGEYHLLVSAVPLSFAPSSSFKPSPSVDVRLHIFGKNTLPPDPPEELINRIIKGGRRGRNITANFAEISGGRDAADTAKSVSDFMIERAGTRSRMLMLSLNGVDYDARQAAVFEPDAEVVVEFSSPPVDPGFTAVRNMVNLIPEPSRFAYRIEGKKIIAELSVEPDVRYAVTIKPVALKDKDGRALVNTAQSSFFAYQPGSALPERPSRDSALDKSNLRLSVIEAQNKALFVATNRTTGRPVFEAMVRVEGLVNDSAAVLALGKTRADGTFTLSHTPEREKKFKNAVVTRIVVYRGADTLVVNASDPYSAQTLFDNHRQCDGGWLAWLGREPHTEEHDKNVRGFVSTDRAVYHADDTMFVKGYVREIVRGAVKLPPAGLLYTVYLMGPETLIPVTLDDAGGFDCRVPLFELPAGRHRVLLMMRHERSEEFFIIADTDFAVGIRHTPKFDIRLSAPDNTVNDRPIEIKAAVSHNDGKPVALQDVVFKVTAYPHNYRPRGMINYVFSSESQQDITTFEEVSKTDKKGVASITIKPRADDGRPVRYEVTAIVKDGDTAADNAADDNAAVNTSAARHTVVALSPVTLGVRANRYITKGTTVEARVAAFGTDDSQIERQRVTVSLKRLSFKRRLADSDFSRGLPEYIIEETAERVAEKTVETDKAPKLVEFKNQKLGVYAVEVSTRDGSGRIHTVTIDVFLAGNGRQEARQKTAKSVLEAISDRNFYEPGQQAKILLRSPHKTASILAIVEKPSGDLQYRWVSVSNGRGTFTLDIKPDMAPGVPVTFLLTHPISKGEADADDLDAVLNKTIINVFPVANMLDVRLTHAPLAAPGGTLDVTISLRDLDGRPRAGEVALWVTDESSAPQGAPIDPDPLEGFMTDAQSRIRIRDTRNIALVNKQDTRTNQSGADGLREGRGTAAVRDESDFVIRSNTAAARYRDPSIKIDKSGTATIKIPVTREVTNYTIRAIAVSGPDRFGTARSRVSVRSALEP